jgi:hypothetical protein
MSVRRANGYSACVIRRPNEQPDRGSLIIIRPLSDSRSTPHHSQTLQTFQAPRSHGRRLPVLVRPFRPSRAITAVRPTPRRPSVMLSSHSSYPCIATHSWHVRRRTRVILRVSGGLLHLEKQMQQPTGGSLGADAVGMLRTWAWLSGWGA